MHASDFTADTETPIDSDSYQAGFADAKAGKRFEPIGTLHDHYRMGWNDAIFETWLDSAIDEIAELDAFTASLSEPC